jgi:hypothetical protein
MTESIHNKFDLLFFFATVWVVLWVAISIVYCLRKLKTLPRIDQRDILFREWRTSGASHRSLFTRLSGARNCLVVTVTKTELHVSPIFPLNLMFLPGINDLEHHIPLDRITNITSKKGFLRRRTLIVDFFGEDCGKKEIELTLRSPEDFLSALEKGERKPLVLPEGRNNLIP